MRGKKVIRYSDKKIFIFEEFRTTGKSGNGKLCAFESENCDCYNGVLTSGVGIKTLKDIHNNTIVLPDDGSDMKRLEYVRKNNGNSYTKSYFLQQTNNSFYRYDEDKGDFVFVRSLNADKNVMMMDALDVASNAEKMIFGEDGLYKYSYNANRVDQMSGAKAVAGCFCKYRAFYGTSFYKIVASKIANAAEVPEALNESGSFFYFTDKGNIIDMLTYKEDVYVFLERGISKVKTAGRTQDFAVEEIPYAGENILPHSQVEIDGKFYFLTTGGVYIVDGEKSIKAYEALCIQPKEDEAVGAVVWEDRYLIRYTDKVRGLQTLVLEKNGKYGYVAFDMPRLCHYEGNAYCQQGRIVQFLAREGRLPAGKAHRFLSERLRFGSDSEKTLRSLCFEGSGIFRVIVRSERRRREIAVDLTDGWARTKSFVKGKEFSFEFILENGATITRMSVEAECLKGR